MYSSIRKALFDGLMIGIILGYTIAQATNYNLTECKAPLETWLLVYCGAEILNILKQVILAIIYGNSFYLINLGCSDNITV